MIIGFTGTRNGMTTEQLAALEFYMEGTGVRDYFHHGDCLGADAQAHDIAIRLGLPVTLYPPADDSLRAFCKGATHTHKPSPYLTRNHAIVLACGILIACPAGPEPRSRRAGGTWYTIRDARDTVRRPFTIIWPDGSLESTT